MIHTHTHEREREREEAWPTWSSVQPTITMKLMKKRAVEASMPSLSVLCPVCVCCVCARVRTRAPAYINYACTLIHTRTRTLSNGGAETEKPGIGAAMTQRPGNDMQSYATPIIRRPCVRVCMNTCSMHAYTHAYIHVYTLYRYIHRSRHEITVGQYPTPSHRRCTLGRA